MVKQEMQSVARNNSAANFLVNKQSTAAGNSNPLKPCICGAAAQCRLDNRAMLIDCVDVDCYWQLRQPYLDGSHTWEGVKATWNNRPTTIAKPETTE